MSDKNTDNELTIDAAFCRELWVIRLPFYLRRNKKYVFYTIAAIFFLILIHHTGDSSSSSPKSTISSITGPVSTMAKTTPMTSDASSSSSSSSTSMGPEGGVPLHPQVEANFADTWSSRPIPKGPDVPLFWNVPKAGGNAIKFILSKCYGFIMASEAGAAHETENLEVISIAGASFVNVNIVSLPGILHAQSLSLASSGLPDVMVSPHIHEMAALFSPSHKGRLFTILRHPVDRAVSIFYHEQRVNPNFAGMSVAEYFGGGGGVVENNWMTRFLTGKKGGTLTPDDLTIAMEILRRKVLVGLMDEMEESLRRFKSYFGWVDDKNRGESDTGACERQQFLSPQSGAGMGDIPRGSQAWNLIMQQNRFDMQVYEYALSLFGEQKGMLESLTKRG